MAYNFHSNAAALIIAAAKKSGLLDGIAEALCFIDKTENPGGANIPQYTEEELKPYFSIPFDVHVATTPPRFDIDFDKIFPIDSTPIAND